MSTEGPGDQPRETAAEVEELAFLVASLLPCHGTTGTIHAWVGFEGDELLESPPSLSIKPVGLHQAPPPAVGPQLVLGSGSDPDDDLASLHWEVDGILLAPEIDELEINSPHEIRSDPPRRARRVHGRDLERWNPDRQ